MRQLFHQKIQLVSRGFISIFVEQRLRQSNSKDFMSDERETANEMINYSVYKGNRIALKQIQLQMYVSRD